MMIRFPEPLRPGDTIAVTAPSSGVPVSLHPRLDLALASLRKRGYRVVEGQCLRANPLHVSASAKVRSAELERFLTDPAISAVMPPWPGFARSHAAEGALLFLENAQMQPCELARALLSLRLHGWFDNVAGVLFGRDASVLPTIGDGFTSDHAIAFALEGLDLPVLLDLDIGHVPPQMALVQGALATVEFSNRSGCAHQHHA